MVDNTTQKALEALESLEQQRERELAEVRAAIASLKGVAVVLPPTPREATGPFKGMGALEASELWLREVGKPQTTRELFDALTQRGWRTESNRPTAVIYATLSNAPKKFERTGHGEWALVEWTHSETHGQPLAPHIADETHSAIR